MRTPTIGLASDRRSPLLVEANVLGAATTSLFDVVLRVCADYHTGNSANT
jgi:hypothetical protein